MSPVVEVEGLGKPRAAFGVNGTESFVYDCVPFFNELDILEIRLRELNDVVDYFVVVEAAQTFRGRTKGLILRQNRARFAPFLDKMIFVTLKKFGLPRDGEPDWAASGEAAWMREKLQRDVLSHGIVEARPRDWIMTSDLDEIPRAACVRSVAREAVYHRACVFFEQQVYQNRLNWRLDLNYPWCGTRMLERRFFRGFWNLKKLRHDPHKNAPIPWLSWRTRAATQLRSIVFPQRVPGAGWHLNSMGGADRLAYKFRNIADDRYVADKDTDALAIEIDARRTADITFSGKRFQRAPLAELPSCVATDPKRYAHLIDVEEAATPPHAAPPLRAAAS